jgi:inner membrane protein
MQCGAPIVMLGVGDARGIRTAQLTLDGQCPGAWRSNPAPFTPRYSTRACTPVLPAIGARPGRAACQATLDLELVGTQQVSIVPLGGRTEVQMQSPWPHPSFSGRFLPTERTVRADGFEAQWRLSSLATTAAQDIAESKPVCTSTPGEDNLAYAGAANQPTAAWTASAWPSSTR